jgi:hypothetical protein
LLCGLFYALNCVALRCTEKHGFGVSIGTLLALKITNTLLPEAALIDCGKENLSEIFFMVPMSANKSKTLNPVFG